VFCIREWYPVRTEDRPPEFNGVRRLVCETPAICFEYGDDAVCGPCDWKSCEIIRLVRESAVSDTTQERRLSQD